MHYSQFLLEDFICDPFFQDWVLHPEDASNAFWERWMEENVEKKEVVEQAKNILLNIKFVEHLPNEEQIQNALSRNMEMIEALPKKAHIISIKRFWYFGKVAAIFIGVLMIISAINYYTYHTAKTVVATNYGEIKTIALPDKSTVILNAHSTIRYAAHWQKEHARELWLEGEAFFMIKHLNKNKEDIKKPERFTVHTKDMDIMVLGTDFDIRNREKKTEVVLKAGEIKIEFKDKQLASIVMKPGDLINYNAANHQLVKSYTDATTYTAWTTKKLMLKDASVNDIAQYIKDNYGRKVILQDTSIGSKKLEGTMLLDDLQDVIFVLSSSLNVEIIQKEDTLFFEKSKR